MKKSKKIEIWRVIDAGGAFYTLKNHEGETSDFMKMGVNENLFPQTKVAVKNENGFRTIIRGVSEMVTPTEAKELLASL